MKAGTLNRRITIQQRGTTTDAAGQPVDTWSDMVSVWANIAGNTGLSAIRLSGEVTAPIKKYSFRIRFREGLDESMRVVYNGQNFDIREVRMDYAGREWTDLVAELGANDG